MCLFGCNAHGCKQILVTVTDPLQLTMATSIEKESKDELGLTLQGQLDLLCSRSFIPKIVCFDPQSAFCSMTAMFPNVVLDAGGAKDYYYSQVNP